MSPRVTRSGSSCATLGTGSVGFDAETGGHES